MVNLFSNTFKASYFKYLVGSFVQHFIDLVVIAKHFKQTILVGKIVDSNKEKRNWSPQYWRWMQEKEEKLPRQLLLKTFAPAHDISNMNFTSPFFYKPNQHLNQLTK